MGVEIKLPDLGEGIESGDVLDVMVSEGDTISKNQSILEIETDKATVEVPASAAGTVAKVHVARGQTVAVGDVLVTVEAAVAAGETPSRAAVGKSACRRFARDATPDATPRSAIPPQPASGRRNASSAALPLSRLPLPRNKWHQGLPDPPHRPSTHRCPTRTATRRSRLALPSGASPAKSALIWRESSARGSMVASPARMCWEWSAVPVSSRGKPNRRPRVRPQRRRRVLPHRRRQHASNRLLPRHPSWNRHRSSVRHRLRRRRPMTLRYSRAKLRPTPGGPSASRMQPRFA